MFAQPNIRNLNRNAMKKIFLSASFCIVSNVFSATLHEPFEPVDVSSGTQLLCCTYTTSTENGTVTVTSCHQDPRIACERAEKALKQVLTVLKD